MLGVWKPSSATGAVRIVTPTCGAVLVAGEVIDVRWEGLPANVDEMELLLDMPGSAEIRLRLTPQLNATTESYRWRVPNLPGRNARLRLRWGRDGVETEGEAGAAFTILPHPHAPLTGVRFRAGEWWVGGPFAMLDRPIETAGPSVHAPTECPLAAALTILEAAAASDRDAAGYPMPVPEGRSTSSSAPSPDVAAHGPREFPLRP